MTYETNINNNYEQAFNAWKAAENATKIWTFAKAMLWFKNADKNADKNPKNNESYKILVKTINYAHDASTKSNQLKFNIINDYLTDNKQCLSWLDDSKILLKKIQDIKNDNYFDIDFHINKSNLEAEYAAAQLASIRNINIYLNNYNLEDYEKIINIYCTDPLITTASNNLIENQAKMMKTRVKRIMGLTNS